MPTYNLTTHCRCLQGFTGTLRGGFCNICRENPVIFTDCREIAGKIFKYYRVFPADIVKNLYFPCKGLKCTYSRRSRRCGRYCRKPPRRVPVNPCKHLQCRAYLVIIQKALGLIKSARCELRPFLGSHTHTSHVLI